METGTGSELHAATMWRGLRNSKEERPAEGGMPCCMAWGDTPEETLEEPRAVAKALIQSRKERGIPLLKEVAPQQTGRGA